MRLLLFFFFFFGKVSKFHESAKTIDDTSSRDVLPAPPEASEREGAVPGWGAPLELLLVLFEAGLDRLMEEVKADEILRFVDPVVVAVIVVEGLVLDMGRFTSPSRIVAGCCARDGTGPLIF